VEEPDDRLVADWLVGLAELRDSFMELAPFRCDGLIGLPLVDGGVAHLENFNMASKWESQVQ
jgi:hypothetical protein